MSNSYYKLHDTTVREDDGKASVSITRTGDISYRERVRIGSSSGTARSGNDFNVPYQWVYFQPN